MSQVFVGNGRASLPERSESPSAAAEYSQIICDFTPVSPTRRHRLNPGCGYVSMPRRHTCTSIQLQLDAVP